MEHTSQTTRLSPGAAPSAAQRPGLALVTSRFQLALPTEPAPDAWREGVDILLGWLGIAPDFVAAEPPRRLPRMADWGMPSAAAARSLPVFAPWLGWSPAAFQHGGLPGLPAAQFVTSYLLDHSRNGGAEHGGVDVALMTPHPAVCTAEEAGSTPLPRPGVMAMMINAAKAEGRERLAIILHARQRNTIARQLLAADRALTREGLTLDILTIEDALRPLMAGRAPWDAIIAMPDLRSTVFTLLDYTSGVQRAWPMLWHAGEGVRGLRLVTSEAPGEGVGRLPLDAPALIHALALTLHAAGVSRSAWRLHDAWSRLRDSGVTTTGQGSEGPYDRVVKDSDFLAMIGRDAAVSKRAQHPWRALQNAKIANCGSQPRTLRVVPPSLANSTQMKGR